MEHFCLSLCETETLGKQDESPSRTPRHFRQTLQLSSFSQGAENKKDINLFCRVNGVIRVLSRHSLPTECLVSDVTQSFVCPPGWRVRGQGSGPVGWVVTKAQASPPHIRSLRPHRPAATMKGSVFNISLFFYLTPKLIFTCVKNYTASQFHNEVIKTVGYGFEPKLF